MSNTSFYTRLSAFNRFADFTDDAHYTAFPKDWCLVISDIEGSTDAIEGGRYKDVNLVGAATIAAARNALNGADIPFVFGGDGATFAFDAKDRSTIEKAMRGLQQLAKDNFKLKLRIGLIPVAKLYDAGVALELGRYELVPGRFLAIFRGSGFPLAEKWIKQAGSSYALKGSSSDRTDITGLSCRWNAIPSSRGRVLSLIVAIRDPRPEAFYKEILENLDKICGGKLDTMNPVNTQEASYQSIRTCLRQENRLHAPKWTFKHLYRILEIFIAVAIFRLKIPPGFFSTRHYVESMRSHADYRKFDHTLRMVIDVSGKQAERIHDYLEALKEKKSIFYGLFESKESLMTCYVDDVHDGNHIHFIDGAEGGYAMAAKQMKAQIKEAAI